jgi:hypothetical protein
LEEFLPSNLVRSLAQSPLAESNSLPTMEAQHRIVILDASVVLISGHYEEKSTNRQSDPDGVEGYHPDPLAISDPRALEFCLIRFDPF